MILCVTLNPCLDKTLKVPALAATVGGTDVREVVGGKGNNVARALSRLGRTARPVTFLGGPVGQHCAQLLCRDDRLHALAVATEGPTREILTVLTQVTTIKRRSSTGPRHHAGRGRRNDPAGRGGPGPAAQAA